MEARRAHNPKVVGSNPASAISFIKYCHNFLNGGYGSILACLINNVR